MLASDHRHALFPALEARFACISLNDSFTFSTRVFLIVAATVVVLGRSACGLHFERLLGGCWFLGVSLGRSEGVGVSEIGCLGEVDMRLEADGAGA